MKKNRGGLGWRPQVYTFYRWLGLLADLGLLGCPGIVLAGLARRACTSNKDCARSAAAAGVVVVWCRQGERGGYEARQAKVRARPKGKGRWPKDDAQGGDLQKAEGRQS